MKMRSRIPLALALGTVLLMASRSSAQQQQKPAYPLDTIPEKMPFATPYGPPIGLAQAQGVIQAVVAEATKRGWAMNVAVVDSGGNLVAFVRMDGAQLASIKVAQHKARTAVEYRRPTKAFEEAIQKLDYKYLMTLDDMVGSRGGIPLIADGKIIGAIGCSGGTGSQDEAVCKAGVALVK
jgi:glc operon protein GlcG